MRPVLPDHPSGAALLDVARTALLDEIAPALSGRQRYVVLMVANAMGIAMREIEATAASAEAWARALAHVDEGADEADDPLRALVAAIRGGGADGDPERYAALRATTEIAAGIWKPAPAART